MVLIVDDDAGMVETRADILGMRGHDVATARSGDAAIVMVRRSRYDVALLDIRMPGLNGVETLRAMREVDPRMAVIMMTAFTRDDLVEEARRASAAAVLAKPLDIEKVLTLVDVVGGRGAPFA